MGLFRPYERSEAASGEPEPTDGADQAPGPRSKKDAPTPSRKQAEAARRERLNPTLTPKQARARERQVKARERDESFARAEGAPGKVLVRDFVDSRKSVAQWTMPILMSTLAASLLVSSFYPGQVGTVTAITYGVFALIILDIILMWRRYRKVHAERLPNVPTKGLFGYLLNRTMAMRRLRTPAPRVKPGDDF